MLVELSNFILIKVQNQPIRSPLFFKAQGEFQL